jgi:hypothetical protein
MFLFNDGEHTLSISLVSLQFLQDEKLANFLLKGKRIDINLTVEMDINSHFKVKIVYQN